MQAFVPGTNTYDLNSLFAFLYFFPPKLNYILWVWNNIKVYAGMSVNNCIFSWRCGVRVYFRVWGSVALQATALWKSQNLAMLWLRIQLCWFILVFPYEPPNSSVYMFYFVFYLFKMIALSFSKNKWYPGIIFIKFALYIFLTYYSSVVKTIFRKTNWQLDMNYSISLMCYYKEKGCS